MHDVWMVTRLFAADIMKVVHQPRLSGPTDVWKTDQIQVWAENWIHYGNLLQAH